MQNKKLSLIITTYDDIKNPHYGGGGAVAVHELAKRLRSKYNVSVISWNYNGKNNEKIDGVQYQRFGLEYLSPKPAMFIYQLLLPFITMTKSYDILLESFCPPFTTAFLPLFTKKTVIGIVHMLAAEDMERKYYFPFHLIENRGIKKYQKIIVTSKVLKNKILTINPKCSVSIISNGIDRVSKKNYKNGKYLLFLGRIEIDQKGIDLLVSAFHKFRDTNNDDFQLIIAGDGNAKEMQKLKQLLKDFDMTKSIKLVGKVSGRKKAELLRRAACVVISSRFETFSLTALEAMAYGIPVACFNTEGLSWIPMKAAKKVRPYDTNALAKAILQIISNRKRATDMKKAGKEYARKFTWDSIAKQYEKYITNL